MNRIEQSGVTLLEKEQLNMKQRESVMLKESIQNANPEQRDHFPSRYGQRSLALLAADSSGLKLA